MTSLPPTLTGMLIYAGIAAVIGLLIARYARWRGTPSGVPTGQGDIGSGGVGWGVTLDVVLVCAVVALLALWAVVAGR